MKKKVLANLFAVVTCLVFRIKFEGTSIDSGENLWIDDVKISVQ